MDTKVWQVLGKAGSLPTRASFGENCLELEFCGNSARRAHARAGQILEAQMKNLEKRTFTRFSRFFLTTANYKLVLDSIFNTPQ